MPATALKKFGQMGSPRPARKVQNFPEVQTSAAAAIGGTADRARRGVAILWSIKEIAAHYGVTTTTVHRWIKANMLPEPEKNFGSRRWDRVAVIRAIREIEPRRE